MFVQSYVTTPNIRLVLPNGVLPVRELPVDTAILSDIHTVDNVYHSYNGEKHFSDNRLLQ